ncbi:MAG: sulfur carrier protein ThiS [Longimicrobiales bacterium]
MGANIQITVNGDAREIQPGSTVADLLAQLGLHPQMVVVEHNRQILNRNVLSQAAVHAGDVFELVHFVGGG